MTHEIHSTTLNILNILNDCHLHTGTEIAKTLGVSRTAVWKIIQRLKKYNIDIKSQHQGYGLSFPLFLFNKKEIEVFLKDKKVFLEIFESIPSTSDYLKNKTSLQNQHICLAEHQSKGRGRMGRSWSSPFGRNIYCSLSYILNRDISEISGLSLIIGILTANALSSLDEGLKPSLKWPNDIYVNDQKVGGILIDIIAEANGSCRVIIGIGLNINMKGVKLKDVDKPWVSLEDILDIKLDRNMVVGRIILSIFEGIDVFLAKGMDPFLSDWKGYDLLENKKISVEDHAHIISGTGKGIDKQGYLLLELPSGEVKRFAYGDTTLRL